MNWQQKRKEIGVPCNAKLLISVGELSKRKNHKIIVKALQALPENYWYIIVGSGELKEQLKVVDKTGRLKLLGYRTDIVDLLGISDLFVFPSLQEGLPVALMEAISCGIPCIASRIRGNIDLLDEDNMFVVNSNEISNNFIKKQLIFIRKKSALPASYTKEYIGIQMKILYQSEAQK